MIGVARTDTGFVIALVVVVALVYLLVLRLMDMNEKEPAWALALALAFGAVAALVVEGLFDFTDRTNAGAAFAGAAGKFVAIAGVLAVLGVQARTRGFSEFHGVTDGLVYGAAVGLGFAVGATLIRELSTPSIVTAAAGRFDTLWSTALAGLSEGLFGAVIGVGFGAAASARSAGARTLAVLGGLAAGFLVEWGYALLAFGGSVEGASTVRAWIVLLFPLALVVAVAIASLGRERSAIRTELTGESPDVVSPEELSVLSRFTSRRGRYARLFFKGDFDGWLALRQLHSRQVQLALAKRRAASRPEAAEEVERLRVSVGAARAEAEAKIGPSMFGRGGGG